jgi:hypothetical protein
MRFAAGLVGIATLVAVSGCYGSTEPASEIGPESARLNAKGTANNGEAQTYFEYRLTGSAREPLRTSARTWPAGASGPFSEVAKGLAASTSYSFRVCGNDPGRSGTICAQTRSFTTKPPVEDAVMGSISVLDIATLTVNAHSTATGSSPRGTVDLCCGDPFSDVSYHGTVTCLAVNGNRAAIGSADGDDKMLVTVVDGRLSDDSHNEVTTHGSALPDCASASFDHQAGPYWPGGDLVVNDAP